MIRLRHQRLCLRAMALVIIPLLVQACAMTGGVGRGPVVITQEQLDARRRQESQSFVGTALVAAESDSLAASDARMLALGDLMKSIRTGIKETILLFQQSTTDAHLKNDVRIIEQNLTEATSRTFPATLTPKILSVWKDEAGLYNAAAIVSIGKFEYLRHYFSLLPLESPDEILTRVRALFAR